MHLMSKGILNQDNHIRTWMIKISVKDQLGSSLRLHSCTYDKNAYN